MRLLVITHYFWPENFRINDLTTELARRGHQVTVLANQPNYPGGSLFEDYVRDPAAFARLGAVEIVRVPVITRGRSRMRLALNYLSAAASAALIGAWRLRGRQFDAILAYQPSPATTALPAVLLRSLKRAPVAMWVLDLWPQTLQAMGVIRRGVMLRAIGRMMRFIYDRCDLIMAQSRSFIPEIARLSARRTPVEYLPSWAESVFDAKAVTAAPEVPAQPGAFNIMFAGNLGEAQDFPAVLRAADLLRAHANIRWLLVGDGSMAAWIREEIARRGLQDRVLMLGRHPLERMPSFYRHADALLMCLRDEPVFALTIPGKLQGYLAAGIPVVAMLNGEGAAVVERAACGLTCKAGDAEGLAAAILQLATSPPEQLEQMARNALAISAGEFDRGQLISQVERALESLPR